MHRLSGHVHAHICEYAIPMNLLRIIWGIIWWLLLPLGVSAQVLPVAEKEMTVAERNAAQGFNDTIDRSADDFVIASLIVADPGKVLYSALGHAALHLQCPTFGLDYVYTNEGEGVQGKVFRFLMNDLKMGMGQFSLNGYMQPYIVEGRGVREYRLNLPAEVKTELWRMCDERMKHGMNLKYDPVKRGCAISVVHNVEDAIRSVNKMTRSHYHIDYPLWGKPFDRTLREIFYDNAPHDWGLFWCMTIVGGIVDEPNLPKEEKLICPKELADIWMQSSIDDKPIISESAVVLNEGEPFQKSLISPLLVALMVLALSIIGLFIKYPYMDWSILGIQTILGCLILWVMIIPLPATGWSWLIIPFNPLAAVCWKWRDKWALPYAVVIALWCIGMLCAPHRLVEYAHIVLAISFGIVLLKQKYVNR